MRAGAVRVLQLPLPLRARRSTVPPPASRSRSPAPRMAMRLRRAAPGPAAPRRGRRPWRPARCATTPARCAPRPSTCASPDRGRAAVAPRGGGSSMPSSNPDMEVFRNGRLAKNRRMVVGWPLWPASRAQPSLRSMNCLARILLPVAATGAIALSIPAVASATDYCVKTSCGGTNVNTLEEALDRGEAVDRRRSRVPGRGCSTPLSRASASSTTAPVRWRSSAPARTTPCSPPRSAPRGVDPEGRSRFVGP